MKPWQIVWRSLRQHWLSTSLAVLSIALGTSLLISVVSLREQAHRYFTRVGLGVDAVLGPKGSPLQVVLNAVYHLEEMPGTIPWTTFKQVLEEPIVSEGIPFCTGHSFAGFRVNAIDRSFLTDFEYLPGKRLSFEEEQGGRGRPFSSPDEAVAGWIVAKELGIELGSTFNPVCGVRAGDPVHMNDSMRFVGILAPTGTPHDRAIYIPLHAFYTLEGHSSDVAAMAVDEEYREISGAYLKIKRVRGGAVHPGIQSLSYAVKQSREAQLVVPNEVLPRLFAVTGWADRVLLAIASMVTLLAGAFVFVALFSALRERMRDIALMRSLGATRRLVFGLTLTESVLITLSGGAVGWLLGHGFVGIGSHFIQVETGLRFSAGYLSQADLLLLPAMVAVGLLTGILPALQAYRLSVIRILVPVS